jgi:hypothetical protein
MADPITSEQRLAAIRERHTAATDGPWWFDESDTCWRLHGVMGRIPPLRRDGFFPEQVMKKQILKAAKQDTPYAEYWPDEADAAFIGHAWEDVRDLLAEVDRLAADLNIAFGPHLYLAVQHVLDKALGTNEEDGSGAGIVGDITLIAERMRAAEAEVGRLKAENAQLQREAVREEQATGNLIDERDNFHALLDRFAAAVAPIEVIGEHSSGNDPWLNALDMVTPAVEVDRLDARVTELTALLNDPDRLAVHALELRAIYAEADADAERDRLADGGEL